MEWSVVVRDTETGAVLIDHDGDKILDVASIGKLILLAYVGNELLDDPHAAATRLDRRTAAPVSDSGVWQHLDIDALTVADLASLVFVASDNLAANVLLDHFQLERVRAFRGNLGFTRTDLLDVVRDMRGPDDPEALSRGTASELCGFMMHVARGDLISTAFSNWMRDGLSLNTDLSMVPSPLGLDPLAHARPADNRPAPAVANKTGTDKGVRADAGIITGASREFAYAAICNYDGTKTKTRAVLELMHVMGEAIRDRSAAPAT